MAKKKTTKKRTPPKPKKKPAKPAQARSAKPARGLSETPEAGVSSPTPLIMTPMPTAGRVVTDFEKALDKTIAEHPQPQHGGARPGSGRKTKPKAPPPPEVQPVQPAEISSAITELLRTPFDLWAAKAKLPELALTNEEAETVTKPVQVLLDFYVPNMRPIDWAWASLAITGIAIMRPRVMLLQRMGPGPGSGSAGSQREEKATPPRPAASASPAGQGSPDDQYEPQSL